MIQEYHLHYIIGFVQLSSYYIYCYMYIFKMWRISIHHNLISFIRHVHVSKIPWKTEFNFLLAFENQNKLVRCSVFNGFSTFIPGNQMTQWFLEMLRVWQNFQILMTVKYLPSGWPSLVEVGDWPSWLSWWAKAALCCCKSSSWLCFSSLISLYNTNIHTDLLRSRLKGETNLAQGMNISNRGV